MISRAQFPEKVESRGIGTPSITINTPSGFRPSFVRIEKPVGVSPVNVTFWGAVLPMRVTVMTIDSDDRVSHSRYTRSTGVHVF